MSNVDFSNADVFISSFNPSYGNTHPFRGKKIKCEKAQWYLQCLNKMLLITFHNKHQAKMNFRLVRLRGSYWREDLILLPLEKRGPM